MNIIRYHLYFIRLFQITCHVIQTIIWPLPLLRYKSRSGDRVWRVRKFMYGCMEHRTFTQVKACSVFSFITYVHHMTNATFFSIKGRNSTTKIPLAKNILHPYWYELEKRKISVKVYHSQPSHSRHQTVQLIIYKISKEKQIPPCFF